MVTIQTKYYGPTNFKGARIKVWSTKDRPVMWVSYTYETNPHIVAIQEYCIKMGWTKQNLQLGSTDEGMVAVFLDNYNQIKWVNA